MHIKPVYSSCQRLYSSVDNKDVDYDEISYLPKPLLSFVFCIYVSTNILCDDNHQPRIQCSIRKAHLQVQIVNSRSWRLSTQHSLNWDLSYSRLYEVDYYLKVGLCFIVENNWTDSLLSMFYTFLVKYRWMNITRFWWKYY